MFGVLTIHASRDNFLLTAGRQAVWTPSLPKPCTPPPLTRGCYSVRATSGVMIYV